MKHRSLRALVALALSWLLPAAFAAAQTATSTLSGVVRDESGAAVPGATVTASNVDTGATRKTTTDAAGRYAFASLDPGDYELRVELHRLQDRGAQRPRPAASAAPAWRTPPWAWASVAEEVTVQADGAAGRDAPARDLSRVVGQRRSSRCRTSAATSWTS